MKPTLVVCALASGLALTCDLPAGAAAYVEKAPGGVGDRQDFIAPDRVQLEGWIGRRVIGNEAARLVQIDTERLLEGYRQRPGRQAWDGEHVGKWLHAATLAWVNTGDPALRAKLDATVAALAGCQLDDGYLGTYLEPERWTSWDVWAHKYNLIGLLTYMRYTGNLVPLTTCRRMADYLLTNLGDGPGQRDIITAGIQHVGMASTSVLEPMVLLYRLTGDRRYLDFCHYLTRAWEQSNGPHIVSRLLAGQDVSTVGNGKAYEMLSCLNGALELYRCDGDRRLLDACLAAWRCIVDKHLYLTGAASIRERFRDEHQLPNKENIGETCVTVTWLQFNAQLLRLTGEARFAEQLERVVLNQLMGAQQPDCAAWGYYVQMEGRKPYTTSLDGHCCLSSGPRGVALIPTFAVSTDADGLVVNLYDAGTARLTLRDGAKVRLRTDTLYPGDGRVRLQVDPEAAAAFAVKLRIPAWCPNASARVNGRPAALAPGVDGYAALRRSWAKGDVIELELPLAPRLVVGDHLNTGKAALLHGPLVLAADESALGVSGQRATTIALPGTDLSVLRISPEAPPAAMKADWPGLPAFQARLVARFDSATHRRGDPLTVRLVPFAAAGGTGAWYRVWLPLAANNPDGADLLLAGRASVSGPVVPRSRYAREGADTLNDDDLASGVIVQGTPDAAEAWFAVTLPTPVPVWRIAFVQGALSEQAGWFDTSAGKPRVEVQRAAGGPWEHVGLLADYPETTAVKKTGIQPGRSHTLRLPEAMPVMGVRVVGAFSGAGAPAQRRVSCGELQAFAR